MNRCAHGTEMVSGHNHRTGVAAVALLRAVARQERDLAKAIVATAPCHQCLLSAVAGTAVAIIDNLYQDLPGFERYLDKILQTEEETAS